MGLVLKNLRFQAALTTSSDQTGVLLSSTSFPNLAFTARRNGVGQKGFKALIDRHQNATTAFSAEGFDVEFYRPAKFYMIVKPGAQPAYRLYTNGFLLDSTVWTATGISYSSANNRALANFYKAIQEAKSAFNGSNFLGELRETIHTVRHPLQSIRRHLNDYLTAVLKEAKKPSFRNFRQKDKLRAITGTWLEYRFGFRPFFKDIEALLAKVGDQIDEDTFVNVKAKYEDQDSTYETSTVSNIVNNYMWYVSNRRRFGRVIVKYYGQLRIKAAAPGIRGFATNAHLAIEDFVPTLWEVFPMSWLVDYFVNVGEVLQGLTIDLTGLAWYGRTIRRSIHTEVYATPDLAKAKLALGSSLVEYGGAPGFYRFITTAVNRDVPVLSVPSFRFELPTYPVSLMNMTAFILQHRLVIGAIKQ